MHKLKTRKQIEEENKTEIGSTTSHQINPLLLEVLLDIRELLELINHKA